jgi:hypothetical protein
VQDLRGREVEVITADITYRGILVEVDEHEVYLRSESGWITISVNNVAEIREAG